MRTTDAIAAELVDYLSSAPDVLDPIDPETDLLESGRLDSLQVMDLVCFLQDRFQVHMQPAQINPHNLRTVSRLAHYIQTTLSSVGGGS